MAGRIARVMEMSITSMPKRLQVKFGMHNNWHILDVLEALASLTGKGIIGGFDAEDAYDTGNGYITIL